MPIRHRVRVLSAESLPPRATTQGAGGHREREHGSGEVAIAVELNPRNKPTVPIVKIPLSRRQYRSNRTERHRKFGCRGYLLIENVVLLSDHIRL